MTASVKVWFEAEPQMLELIDALAAETGSSREQTVWFLVRTGLLSARPEPIRRATEPTPKVETEEPETKPEPEPEPKPEPVPERERVRYTPELVERHAARCHRCERENRICSKCGRALNVCHLCFLRGRECSKCEALWEAGEQSDGASGDSGE